MNYYLKSIILIPIVSLSISSCNNDQNSEDLQPSERVELSDSNVTVIANVDITQLSLEELTDLESELSSEARGFQTEFFTLLEGTNTRATTRAGRNFLRTQRNLISVTREFIRRARAASNQGEVGTRRRILELQRDLLREIRTELDFVLNS